MVEFEAVEERIDDVVDGLLENGVHLGLVRRPAADLLRDEAHVQRQTAVGQRQLDDGQLTTGQCPAGGVQSFTHDAHAQLGSKRRDAQEVLGTGNSAANAHNTQ